MKIFEKVLLIGLFITFCLCFVDSTFRLLLNLIVLACIIAYGIFGFKLLRKTKNLPIPIITGIVFSLAFASFLNSIRLNQHEFVKIFAWINIAFAIILLFFLMIKKKSFNYKEILYRSIFFTAVCSFFAFSSPYNDLYRWCIQEMNTDNQLYNNMRMFDQTEKYSIAIEKKDFKKGIKHALEAKKYGEEWIKNNFNEEYDRIGQAYDNLFLAYRDYGDTLFDGKQYEKALVNYYKADSLFNESHYNIFLNDYDKELSYWNKARIAKTYIELYEHDKTDSIYNYLIESYSKVKDTIDDNYAYLVKNLAKSHSNRIQHNQAAKLRELVLDIYSNNPVKHKKNIVNTSYLLTNDYLNLNLLSSANKHINHRFDLLSLNEFNYCVLLIQQGVYYSKQNDYKNALATFNNSIDCLGNQKQDYPKFKMAALMSVANINIVLSDFLEAKKIIQIGYDIIQKNNFDCKGQSLSNFNSIEADLFYAKGNLNKALELYYTSNENNSLCNEIEDDYINARIAFLESEFYNYNKVEKLTQKVLSELVYYNSITPSNLVIHNSIANANTSINPELSDSLYNVTINVCKKYKQENSPQYANALNGLGTLASNNSEYRKADSLFYKSLEIGKKLYHKATVNQLITFTNLTNSKAKQKNEISFDKYYTESLSIIHNLQLNNTIYEARLLTVKANYLMQLNKYSEAKDTYLKALKIYDTIFNNNHPEVIYLKNKLL